MAATRHTRANMVTRLRSQLIGVINLKKCFISCDACMKHKFAFYKKCSKIRFCISVTLTAVPSRDYWTQLEGYNYHVVIHVEATTWFVAD